MSSSSTDILFTLDYDNLGIEVNATDINIMLQSKEYVIHDYVWTEISVGHDRKDTFGMLIT